MGLLNWLRGKISPPPSQVADSSRLRVAEGLVLGELEPLAERRCPDCGGDSFLAGPQGGVCTNIKCETCGSRFNVSLWGGTLLHAERI